MAKIHYFPRYSQPENFMTNNTLLLLLRLYDTSRLKFENFLATILSSTDSETPASIDLGLQITQQVGTKSSVLDGALYQKGFKIAIETKLDARAFRQDQLIGHLATFEKGDAGWLLLLSPDAPQVGPASHRELYENALKDNITIVPITFQIIIESFRKCLALHDEELKALIDDYEEFCGTEGLLPSDQWTVFTPPCSRSFDVNRKYNLYFCPSSWSRRRGHFLGIYNWKSIRLIGKISKIVDYDVALALQVSGPPMSTSEEQRIQQSAHDFDLEGIYQFYLCDRFAETDFKKTTPGGIMGHRYLDLRKYLPKYKFAGIENLATDLKSVEWG